jgi:uncharacterized damage-inducible protein DinB
MQRPAAAEHAPDFQKYVALVPDGPILAHLEERMVGTAELLQTLSEPQAMHRYAPGKWSVKEVIGHLADAERVFAYRALCVARDDQTPLPGFDEDSYAAKANTDRRPLPRIVEELRTVRAATLSLFGGFDAAAAARIGNANGIPVSVRALAWIIAGHELHHLGVLRERYGVG